jgi:hypothetical protein
MPKPTSRFGPKTEFGDYRWEGCYLYWPSGQLLVTTQRWRPQGSTDNGLIDLCNPTKATFMANYALLALRRFTEGEQEFFDPAYWPRRFRVVKDRMRNTINREFEMTLLDFKLTLIS